MLKDVIIPSGLFVLLLIAMLVMSSTSEKAGLAIGTSAAAIADAARAEREARLAQYYATDLKVWLGTQGLKPPNEPWNKEKHK